MKKDYLHRKNRWIYSLPLARWLIENGFECIRTTKDLLKPDLYNFLFKNSDELEACIQEYEKGDPRRKSRHKYENE